MASETTNISMRLDKDLKENAEKLFDELGINMTTAFNIFLRQSVREQKIPFELSLNVPNAETERALSDIHAGRDITSFENSKDMFKELGI